jgi:predicted phosphoribosyltransferase
MFKDRQEAGQKLAGAVRAHKNEDPVVLAIPRGGVEVGYEVAKWLKAPFSIIVVRKLPFPDNPESGFGAIAEDGSSFFIDQFSQLMDSHTIEAIISEQKQEIQKRIRVLRQGETPVDVFDRFVILVDDGIAMGSTMQAAIRFCRNEKAKKIVVAVPVAGPSTVKRFMDIVDDIVVLEQPPLFRAVAEAYQNWYDVGDDEVVSILRKYRQFS